MGLTFNSLFGVSGLQRSRTGSLFEKNLEQLSSGKRINRAQDDASGMALAKTLEASIRGLEQSNRNIDSSKGILSTAGSAYGNQVESLQRMRDLAVSAANGALSEADRQNLNQEFQAQVANTDDIAKNTSFGDKKLIDGSMGDGVEIQSGSQAGQTTAVALEDTRGQALGISGLDVSTQQGAEDALDKIDAAIGKVVSAQAKVGAAESQIEFRENANAVQIQNTAEAKSLVEDLDLAEATSENQRLSLLKEAQILASKKSQQIKGLLINLFK